MIESTLPQFLGKFVNINILCSLPTPKKILVARSCTWTSGSVCLHHPHTSAPYNNTESTKASNNLMII